ncbi:PRC-barrel domain-containing protein [Lichenicoccus sp.]|uniref:PRC-barrel domain-containing protein n=1 Tax=Lichenicoccus sp. TaxID=2781899 RepID=UPI003D143F05
MSPMPICHRHAAGLLALLFGLLPATGLRAAPPPAKPIPLTPAATPAPKPSLQSANAPTANAPTASASPTSATAANATTTPSTASPKPLRKVAPKPGPGLNDAGQKAATLRTTKLKLFGLIDRSVTGREKREIGHVVDVLVDAKGQPTALVVDVGGFMGMGNRRIAIDWERFALSGRKPGDALQIPFSDAQIKAAPAYDGSHMVTVVQGSVAAVAANAPPAQTRVDLGEDLGPLSNTTAAPADSLNPD